jgi:hypothetical protein
MVVGSSRLKSALAILALACVCVCVSHQHPGSATPEAEFKFKRKGQKKNTRNLPHARCRTLNLDSGGEA